MLRHVAHGNPCEQAAPNSLRRTHIIHQQAPNSAGLVSRPWGNPPVWKTDHVQTAELLLVVC